MKLDFLETHDRLQHMQSQSSSISECVQAIIDQEPFGKIPFYIFAHKRSIDIDERISLFLDSKVNPNLTVWNSLGVVPTHRIIWQPRLTKPKAEENSMLFKAYAGTDMVKTIWIIPEQPLWEMYTRNKMMESCFIVESICNFRDHRAKLEAKEEDDLDEQTIDAIYKELSQQGKIKAKQSSSEAVSLSSHLPKYG